MYVGRKVGALCFREEQDEGRSSAAKSRRGEALSARGRAKIAFLV